MGTKKMNGASNMSYVGPLRNILTRAFIHLYFTSGFDENGKLLHTNFLCHNCYYNYPRSIYAALYESSASAFFVSALNNIMCNVHLKSASPTCLCIHLLPNRTKTIIYALKGAP